MRKLYIGLLGLVLSAVLLSGEVREVGLDKQERVGITNKSKNIDYRDYLYGEWEESTDSEYIYDTYTEVITKDNLIAQKYTITNTEVKQNGDIYIYYTTDFMKARLILHNETMYTTGECNYYIEESEFEPSGYYGDTLYMRKVEER